MVCFILQWIFSVKIIVMFVFFVFVWFFTVQQVEKQSYTPSVLVLMISPPTKSVLYATSGSICKECFFFLLLVYAHTHTHSSVQQQFIPWQPMQHSERMPQRLVDKSLQTIDSYTFLSMQIDNFYLIINMADCFAQSQRRLNSHITVLDMLLGLAYISGMITI